MLLAATFRLLWSRKLPGTISRRWSFHPVMPLCCDRRRQLTEETKRETAGMILFDDYVTERRGRVFAVATISSVACNPPAPTSIATRSAAFSSSAARSSSAVSGTGTLFG